MNYSVISCASFGASGSGVVTDFLSEFDNIHNPGDFEFRFLQDYGGVTTLEDCLVHSHHRLNSDIAIQNFIRYVEFQCGDFINARYNRFFKGKFGEISQQFLNEIIDIEWPVYREEYQIISPKLVSLLKYRIIPHLKQLLSGHKKYIAHYLPHRTMYFSNPSESEFVSAVNRYINRLCAVIDPNHEYKYLYFDQLLPPTNIDRYFRYFDDLHVIVVDRDPRDYYIGNVIKWGEGWVPKDVDKFIKLFSGIRKKIDKENEDSRILRVRYEDTIFHYEEFKSKMMAFLGLEPINHVRPMEKFNPRVSINNAQLWKTMDVDYQIIEKIERGLPEFIYPFPE